MMREGLETFIGMRERRNFGKLFVRMVGYFRDA